MFMQKLRCFLVVDGHKQGDKRVGREISFMYKALGPSQARNRRGGLSPSKFVLQRIHFPSCPRITVQLIVPLLERLAS